MKLILTLFKLATFGHCTIISIQNRSSISCQNTLLIKHAGGFTGSFHFICANEIKIRLDCWLELHLLYQVLQLFWFYLIFHNSQNLITYLCKNFGFPIEFWNTFIQTHCFDEPFIEVVTHLNLFQKELFGSSTFRNFSINSTFRLRIQMLQNLIGINRSKTLVEMVTRSQIIVN